MALHRAFYKLERSLAIPPLAGKDLKHLAFVIYGAPQVSRWRLRLRRRLGKGDDAVDFPVRVMPGMPVSGMIYSN